MKKRKYKRQKISKGEKRISELLDNWTIRYIREYKFSDLKSPRGKPLRFDFYLPDFDLLIEYQGHHHYRPINKYKRAKVSHEKTVIHDKIKSEYVKNKNLKLVCIPYTLYDQLDSLMIKIIRKLLYEKQ